MLDDEKQLAQLTYGELFDIHGMGASSVLDFVCTLEGVMDQHHQLSFDFSGAAAGIAAVPYVEELEQIASQDWAGQISRQDPRFPEILPRIGIGTIRDLAEGVLEEPELSSSLSIATGLLDSIHAIRAKIDELKSLSLEESLQDLLRKLMSTRSMKEDERRVAVMESRFGWGGDEPATLQQCADCLAVTRERVRQIQKKIEARIPEHEIFMPALDSALRVLSEEAPVSLESASKLLVNNGISSTTFHPRSIIEAAELLGKQTGLTIIGDSSRRMLVRDEDIETTQTVDRVARKLASRSGAASIFQVVDSMAAGGSEVGEKSVRNILAGIKTLEFLSDDWYRRLDAPPDRDRLRNSARRMLSVVSPQSILSIRDGLRRTYQHRAGSYEYPMIPVVPPLEIVKRALGAYSEFDVIGNEVSSSRPLNYTTELGETERVIVEVLRTAPAGVMERRSFAEGCISRGVNENTFSLYSSYSCILEHVDLDVWKLRGVKVDPAAIEAVRASNRTRRKEKRLLGHGWTADGKLWIAVRVPRLGKESLVIAIPSSILRILGDRVFKCYGKGSVQQCGNIAINEQGVSHGYGVFIRRMGIDESDILLAEFDISSGSVTLSVGDEHLLDDEI